MTNTAVATTQPKSVLIDMATRYGMEPAAFEATVRATCMRPDKNGKMPTREEFAAFLLVAREYHLNPITKEIHAFVGKGGGVVPIVSIDGWVNLINSHGQLDGIQFEMHHSDNGALEACTCRIFRKDRTHPVEVTEYLSECYRATDAWKMPHRMLRHKSLIQCARYAFGFAGIYDEDEGERIVEAQQREVSITPPKAPKAPAAPRLPKVEVESVDADTEEVVNPGDVGTKPGYEDPFDADITDVESEPIDYGAEQFMKEQDMADNAPADPQKMLDALDADLGACSDEATVEEVFNTHDLPARFQGMPNGAVDAAIALRLKQRALERIAKASK
jgi:phage recombination protein Bet